MSDYKTGDVVVGINNVPAGWAFIRGDSQDIVRIKTEKTGYLRLSPVRQDKVQAILDVSSGLDTKCTLLFPAAEAIYNAVQKQTKELGL